MAIKFRRGTHAQKETVSQFESAEPLFETDTKRLYIGTGTSTGIKAVLIGGNNTAYINEWQPDTNYFIKDSVYRTSSGAVNLCIAIVDHNSGSTFISSNWSQVTGGSIDGMTKSIYDPSNISANVFNVDNHVSGTTNKVYTTVEQTKLSGIAVGAEVNVNADWLAISGDALILNKPAFLTELDGGSPSDVFIVTQDIDGGTP